MFLFTTASGVHPYRIALQFLQCGRSAYRDDNHGDLRGISDYSGRLVYWQRDGNAGEPSRGTFQRILQDTFFARQIANKFQNYKII